MTYPKVNGKPFDSLRRKEFDKLRKSFRWAIADAASRNKEVLSSGTLTTAAWNCAFLAVTSK